jgi:hypothetical protein
MRGLVAVAVAAATIGSGVVGPDGHAMSGARAAQISDDFRSEQRPLGFGGIVGVWSQHPPSEIANPQRFRLAQNPPFAPTEDRQNRSPLHRVPRRTAEELYKATSRDAETFEAALLIPEVRLKLERALHQKLPDQLLKRLASEAKAEALYWYKYMQDLDRIPSTYAPDR